MAILEGKLTRWCTRMTHLARTVRCVDAKVGSAACLPTHIPCWVLTEGKLLLAVPVIQLVNGATLLLNEHYPLQY